MKRNIVIIVFLFSIILPCFAIDFDAYYERGVNKYKLKDYIGAADDFTKAIDLNPTDYKSYFNRGLSKYRLGSKKGSIADVMYSGEIYKQSHKEKTDEQDKAIKKGVNSSYINFTPYMRKLQRKIRQNWSPDEYGCSLTAEIAFKIDKSGNVKWMRLLKSSGNKEFDNEAILAFIKAVPFKPLPKEFSGQSIDVKFCFDQKLNKF